MGWALNSKPRDEMETTEMAPATLTDLPDSIIDEILCRLPIADAVRTCILSRTWRRRWQSIPDLDLSGIAKPIASRILLLHYAPIRLLKAAVEGDVLASLSGRSTAATLRTLHLHDFGFCLPFIACSFPHLTDLQLIRGSSEYQHRDFSRFKALQTLHLESVKFIGSLSLLFSACPLLEEASLIKTVLEESQCLDIVAPNLRVLYIESISDIDRLAVTSGGGDFSGLKNLRILHLEYLQFRGHLSMLFSACPSLEEVTLVELGLVEPQCLDIVAPNLRELTLLRGDYYGCVDKFTITSAPVLEEVMLEPDYAGRRGDCELIMNVFGGMPNVKNLHLDARSTFKYLIDAHIPRRLPISFHHLKAMSLDVNFDSVSEVSLTLCLLRSCPNLQEFVYEGFSYNHQDTGVGLDFWESQDQLGLFDKLETVEMTIVWIESELDFIQFVLARAQLLKEMMIYFDERYLVTDKDLVRSRVLEFPVISNQAQILFTRY